MDINKRPCGSRIKEREMWVEEIDIMCQDKRMDKEDEKRNNLEGKAKEERRSSIIDARKGAMVIS